MKKSALLWVFGIALILEVIFSANLDWASFRVVTKPLLLSSLIVYFLLHRTEAKTKLLVGLALLFSFIGDILLMFTDKSAHFFMFGLISFLIAHVFYIIQFSRNRNKNKSILIPLLLLLILGGSIFWFLKDSLGAMLFPVAIYMTIILTMVLFAFLRKGSASKKSFELIMVGAILFLISDSILAINKFKSPVPLSGVWIMGTYGLAQLLIVLGVLKEEKSNDPAIS